MPNRILRDGIISSARINALSLGAEVLYRRLMSVADDYGRFYASLAAIRGACWPTHLAPPSEGEIDDWMDELNRGDDPLIRVYSAASGVRYIEIVNFNQQTRSKSKFPEPDINLLADAEQLHSTTRARTSPNNEYRTTTDEQRKTPTARNPPAEMALHFEDFWKRYPRQQGKDRAAAAWAFNVTIETEAEVFACLERYLKSGDVSRGATMYADKWLNERRADSWESQWELPVEAPRKLTATERTIRKFQEMEKKNGTQ